MDIPRGQVEASLEAAEDVDLRLGPDVLDAALDPVDDASPHMMLLRAGHHPLEEVLDLLMQPAQCTLFTIRKAGWYKCHFSMAMDVRADDRRQNPILIYECSSSSGCD